MEHLRTVKVTVEVDTNKNTYVQEFVLGEYDDEETVADLEKRASDYLSVRLEF